MTKDEALDLALEALENLFGIPDQFTGEGGGDVAVWRLGGSYRAKQAITAIKQARALDKMAENARELGLDYEPVAPVQEDWGPGPHECHSLTASVQEPVAWRYRGILHDFDPSDWAEGPVTPLYTTPPAAQRQWVGLTDVEIDNLSREMVKGKKSVNWLSYSIEAKLKELNT